MSSVKFQHIPWFAETYSADIYSADWVEFCVALIFFVLLLPQRFVLVFPGGPDLHNGCQWCEDFEAATHLKKTPPQNSVSKAKSLEG